MFDILGKSLVVSVKGVGGNVASTEGTEQEVQTFWVILYSKVVQKYIFWLNIKL